MIFFNPTKSMYAVFFLLLSFQYDTVQSGTPEFVDCRFSPCKLLESFVEDVSEDHKIAYMTLPKNFLITVEYYFDEIPEDALKLGSQQLQNVYEIFDIKRNKGLLSVYRAMYGGKTMVLFYDEIKIPIPNGKGFEFEFGWNTLTIEVKEMEIIVYGKLYDPRGKPKEYIFDLPWPGTIHSKEAIFYASQDIDAYKARRRYISGGGKIRHVYISGSLCCHSTSYYTLDWESECVDGGNNALEEDIQSCSTCITYQCLDWIVGSEWMKLREQAYYEETGDEVYFGLGAVQNTNADAGKCFRMKLNATEVDDLMTKDMVVQAVTRSKELLPKGSFQLIAAGGGFEREEPNACTSYPREYMTPVPNGATNYPQFDGPIDDYGWDEGAGAGLNPFTNGGWYKGGWSESKACDRLPEFPICSPYPVDSQRDLCKYTFTSGIRKTFENYRTVESMCEVKCPDQLVEATGLRRADEVSTSTCADASEIRHEKDSQMTFVMNCARPLFSEKANLAGLPFVEGFDSMVPCRRDGYSRVNSVPTFAPTPTPTLPANETPTSFPSTQPTNQPSSEPTWDPASTHYPTSRPSTVKSTKKTDPKSDKATIGQKLTFWDMRIGMFGFFGFFGILLGSIIGMALLVILCCETNFQSKEKLKKNERVNKRRVTQRDFEMSLMSTDSYDDEEESFYSGTSSASGDTGDSFNRGSLSISNDFAMSPEYDSSRTPGDTPRRMFKQMQRSGGNSASSQEVDDALNSFHTPGGASLQRMEVGRSAPSTDGSRAGGAGLFTSPTTWMASSFDNSDYQPRERASSNPMLGRNATGAYDSD